MESKVDDHDHRVGSRGRNTQKSTCRSAYTYFKEYCNSTSIHGFKYLAEERSLGERLLWISLITLAFMGVGYLISQIYAKYTESPVIVSFATKESPIYTIPFPAVTICPTTVAQKKLFNFTDFVRKKKAKEKLTSTEERYAKYISYVCDTDYDYFPNEEYFTEDFYQALDEIKIPVEHFMEQCKFMSLTVSCSEWFTPIILDDGVCFTFNILDKSAIYDSTVVQVKDYHKSWKTKWNVEDGYKNVNSSDEYPYRAFMAGADNALEIILYQNETDLDYLCVDDFQGFSVILHAPFSIPQLKSQFFMVPFNRVVNALVLPKVMSTSDKVKIYKPKARECYFSTEKKLKYFNIYAPRNCKLECLTEFTLKMCGCVNFHMPRKNDTAICGNAKFKCVKDAEYLLKLQQYNLQIENEQMDFFCDCKPLCTDVSYDVEQSQAPWDKKEQYKAAGDMKAFDASIRYSKLSVFFKQDSFLTSQRNELYGPTDFLANFGGLMGLFTGFSLLSAAEILYFLSVRLCCNFRLYRSATGIGV
uniref:Pickpocket protein 28-like isoform X1 n=1 Tax=Diabrotica virgifera virgifera TaxID=50390 RepID=A0A6P7F4A8_DIAVI